MCMSVQQKWSLIVEHRYNYWPHYPSHNQWSVVQSEGDPSISEAGVHYDVSCKKAWYARRRPIDIIYRDWPSSTVLLSTHMKELQRSNPSMVVVCDSHPSSTLTNIIFDYLFWAFAPTIWAFRHMKPVICVDVTFIKGAYQGKLLVAIGYDECNNLLSLVFALVDDENNRRWYWIMRLLRIHVCSNVQNIFAISGCISQSSMKWHRFLSSRNQWDSTSFVLCTCRAISHRNLEMRGNIQIYNFW